VREKRTSKFPIFDTRGHFADLRPMGVAFA
jgi:hypothetical protein